MELTWTMYWIISLTLVSVILMLAWEGRVVWWLRLPFINLILFVLLLIAGFIEEIYLTFHPHKRTKYIKSSIFQLFFS
jgi:hypothetical protein